MAKNITIKVPGKHPRTGEITTFELRANASISTSVGRPCLSSFMGGYRNVTHPHPERLPHGPARRLAHRSLRHT